MTESRCPPNLSRIRIVLVHPERPENIGMVARAMRNCGLSRLVMVSAEDPRSEAAYRLAVDASPVLDGAEIHSSLLPAIGASRLVVGSTRRRGQDRRPLITPEELVREVLPRAQDQEVSVLFGSERNGLGRDAIDRCDVLVSIPAHPDLPSFNLAQAVLLIAYTLFRASSPPPESEVLDLVTLQRREEFFRHLERVLLRIGFLQANNPGRILSSLRRLLGRTGLENREVRILRGILSQVEWAVRQRKGKGSKDQEPED